MTELFCIDARLGPLSSVFSVSSPLRFMGRYTVTGSNPPVAGASCDYCGRACETVLIAEVGGAWCQRRFVRAAPPEKTIVSHESFIDARFVEPVR